MESHPPILSNLRTNSKEKFREKAIFFRSLNAMSLQTSDTNVPFSGSPRR